MIVLGLSVAFSTIDLERLVDLRLGALCFVLHWLIQESGTSGLLLSPMVFVRGSHRIPSCPPWF